MLNRVGHNFYNSNPSSARYNNQKYNQNSNAYSSNQNDTQNLLNTDYGKVYGGSSQTQEINESNKYGSELLIDPFGFGGSYVPTYNSNVQISAKK